MCRPIGVAASLLRKTCRQPKFRPEDVASARALAFLLRKDNRHGE
jgi:hypothetical protein